MGIDSRLRKPRGEFGNKYRKRPNNPRPRKPVIDASPRRRSGCGLSPIHSRGLCKNTGGRLPRSTRSESPLCAFNIKSRFGIPFE